MVSYGNANGACQISTGINALDIEKRPPLTTALQHIGSQIQECNNLADGILSAVDGPGPTSVPTQGVEATVQGSTNIASYIAQDVKRLLDRLSVIRAKV